MKSFLLSTLSLILYIVVLVLAIAGFTYYVLPGFLALIFLFPIPNSILLKARACADNCLLKLYNTLIPLIVAGSGVALLLTLLPYFLGL